MAKNDTKMGEEQATFQMAVLILLSLIVVIGVAAINKTEPTVREQGMPEQTQQQY